MTYLLVLASLLLLSGPPADGPRDFLVDEPTPQWPWGPARYILKKREEEAYRALKTPPERRAFIEKFWLQLDPTPDTPLNERRAEFWRRVNLADALFHDSVGPGWKTDRGKIYILLGPPNEMHRYGSYDAWIYRALPMHNTPPEVRFQFLRSRSGEFRLENTLNGRPRAPSMVKPPIWEESPVSVSFEIGNAQIVPGRILLPETGVSTEYFFPILHPVDHCRTYRATDGSTFLVMDVFVNQDQLRSYLPEGAPLNMTLTASVFPQEGGAPVSHLTRRLTLDSEPGAESAAPLHFLASFDLPPGRYRGEFILIELQSRLGSIFSRDLTVPDYRQGLSLSSLSVTHAGAESSAPGSPRGGVPPVWFPSGGISFTAGETLVFSYQVYNARHQQERADLDVEYRIFLASGEKMELVGQPVQLHHVQGETLSYALPLTGYPAADYRIQVMVTDLVAETSAFREGEFRIAARAAEH